MYLTWTLRWTFCLIAIDTLTPPLLKHTWFSEPVTSPQSPPIFHHTIFWLLTYQTVRSSSLSPRGIAVTHPWQMLTYCLISVSALLWLLTPQGWLFFLSVGFWQQYFTLHSIKVCLAFCEWQVKKKCSKCSFSEIVWYKILNAFSSH